MGRANSVSRAGCQQFLVSFFMIWERSMFTNLEDIDFSWPQWGDVWRHADNTGISPELRKLLRSRPHSLLFTWSLNDCVIFATGETVHRMVPFSSDCLRGQTHLSFLSWVLEFGVAEYDLRYVTMIVLTQSAESHWLTLQRHSQAGTTRVIKGSPDYLASVDSSVGNNHEWLRNRRSFLSSSASRNLNSIWSTECMPMITGLLTKFQDGYGDVD